MKLVFPSHKHSGPNQPILSWEEVPCPLCDSRNYEPLLEAVDDISCGSGLSFMVVFCRDCGMCFTNPRPVATDIGQFYPQNYQPHQPTTRKHHWRKRYPDMPRWLTYKHQAVLPQGQGRLLDFGCGGGLFLEQMQAVGWKVTGVDVSASVVEHLRTEKQIEAYSGSLPHVQLQGRQFDVITMWQVLEHLHEPREVLTAARELLAPEGKLIVAVPNIDSLPFRWFGKHWYGLDLPRHLLHFTPQTLRAMLEQCGFELQVAKFVRHSSWLRMSAKLARDHNQCGLRNRMLGWKWFSSWASWYTQWHNATDCLMVTAVVSR